MALPIAAAMVAIGAGQAGFGLANVLGGNKDYKDAQSQRKAFRTTKEAGTILEAAKNMASQGYDAFTLNYLTSQIDKGFSESVGDINRLGGDANDISAVFNQRIQGLMQVGEKNHALNMERFSGYLNAMNMMRENKEAEWASEQDIVKDKLQSANTRRQEGYKAIVGGINTAISGVSAGQTSKLFTDNTKAIRDLAGTLTPKTQATSATPTDYEELLYMAGVQRMRPAFNRPQ